MNTLSVNFQTTEEQRNYVTQLNNEYQSARTQQGLTVESFRQMLRNNGNDDTAAFLSQVLREGVFNNDKHVKQNVKISWQRMTATFYNGRIGMDIVRNTVTIREVKADETINIKGKIVTKESVKQEPKAETPEVGDIQTIENLKATIAKDDQIIDNLQDEINGHINENDNQAIEIDRLTAEVERLRSEVERLTKDKAGTEANYRRLRDAILESPQKITRKKLVAMVS